MEFLKNHYEKLILIVILLSVAVAVALLPAKVPAGLSGDAGGAVPPNKLPAISLKTNELAINKLETLTNVNLTSNHNLLNPVTWRRMQENGPLYKYVHPNEIGPGAIIVNRLLPLYTTITYEAPMPPNKFQFGIVQQAHKDTKQRSKKMLYLAINEKCDYFRLVGVDATPEGAIQKLMLELPDGKMVSVSKEAPYQAVAGYMADLIYPPERNAWTQKRVGDSIQFDQGTNNIVDISSNEVVLSSSSGKRTKLKYKATP